MNPKDGFDFNDILWSFFDQSKRWGKNYKRDQLFTVSQAILYCRSRAAKGLL